MARNFVPCDRDQQLLMPPSLHDWLAPDHLVWFAIDAVKTLDLSRFYACHREDGWGRAAYDPSMMITLLMYAYAIGVRSAREIERRCSEDVAFRVVTAGSRVDHATICRFRKSHREALEELFVSVLKLCADAGLVRPGIVAVDGTKVAANASQSRNLTEEQLKELGRRVLEEAERIDTQEDELYGAGSGDQLPEHLQDQVARLEWLQQKLKEQEAAKNGHRPGNKNARINTTDPDSTLQKTPGGWTQGFNAQAAANENQVIVSADVTSDNNDVNQLEAMITKAQENLEGTVGSIEQVVADAGYYSNDNAQLDLGVEILIAPTTSRNLGDAIAQRSQPGGNDERARRRWEVELALAEQRAAIRAEIMEGYVARYVTAQEAASMLGLSVNRIYWMAWHLKKFGSLPSTELPPPPPSPDVKQVMLERFAQPGATEAYAKRAMIIEPVFGQIKEARGMRRFLHRGLEACRCEWSMVTMAHNLRKAWMAGLKDRTSRLLFGRTLHRCLGLNLGSADFGAAIPS